MSQAAKDAGEAYVRTLAGAGAAFANHDYVLALEKLDVADQIQANVPDTWGMRGAIYAEEHAFEKAEDAFEKQQALLPGDFWPKYNLAQLLLMQKRYVPAGDAFAKLLLYRGHEELVQFKAVYAYLMGGKPDMAKPVLDGMKTPSDTPAYYFAQAAWAFAHNDKKEGDYWTRTSLRVFGLVRSVSFYDALVQAGWLPMRAADGSVPEEEGLSNLAAPIVKPGDSLLPGSGGLPQQQ